MPRYWTGTLNLAQGSAYSEGGWIEDAYIYVKKSGGAWEQIREWHDDPGPGGPISFALSAVFDSTHFDDGDVVFVKFEVNDIVYGIQPTLKSATGFAVVHNKSFSYQHHHALDWPNSDGASQAQYTFTSLGYQSVKHSADWWETSTVMSESHDAAILYFNSHGWPEVETDQSDGLGGNSGQEIFPASDVEPTRLAINGSGLPPQNSTGLPLTQYIHFDTCGTGYSGAYNVWFLPYLRSDFQGEECLDQALFGYAGVTKFYDRIRMAGLYWPIFEDWRTLKEMRDNLLEFCISWYEETGEHYINLELPADIHWHPDEPSDCPIWGDWYMRLKGVYTGDDSYPPGWFRDSI